MVILDHLVKLHLPPRVPVATIDTLHLFPETYELVKKAQRYYAPHLDRLLTYKPQNATDKATFDAMYGSQLWNQDPERYVSGPVPLTLLLQQQCCSPAPL